MPPTAFTAYATMVSMPDDKSRYGQAELGPFEQHLAENADKHAFTFRPWKLGALRLTDEQLVAHVEGEIADQGFWCDFAEMAMVLGCRHASTWLRPKVGLPTE